MPTLAMYQNNLALALALLNELTQQVLFHGKELGKPARVEAESLKLMWEGRPRQVEHLLHINHRKVVQIQLAFM